MTKVQGYLLLLIALLNSISTYCQPLSSEKEKVKGTFKIIRIDRDKMLGSDYLLILKKDTLTYKLFVNKNAKCPAPKILIKEGASCNIEIFESDLLLESDSINFHVPGCGDGLELVSGKPNPRSSKFKVKKKKTILGHGEKLYRTECLCVNRKEVFVVKTIGSK